MDTSRLVCLLRTKWSLEVSQRQLTAASSDGPSPSHPRMLAEPLSEHLMLVCAHDFADHYEYVDAADLASLGLTSKMAFEIAWRNTLQAAGNDLSFEKMPEFGWIPSTAGTDECVALLGAYDTIRSLPVAGRHLAFAPNSRGFWITGTENHTGIALLCAIVLNEYENAEGKPLTPIPMVLGDEDKWHSWLPEINHPSYGEIRSLHTKFAHEVYEEQRLLLRGRGSAHPESAFVAAHFLHTYGEPNNELTFSSSVWADVETLLPKTDLIELKPLLNRAAMEQDDSVEPQFGKTVSIAWEKLAAMAGDCLQPQGMYPERYLVPTFSGGPLWEKLQQIEIQSPYELFPWLTPSARWDSPTAEQGKQVPLAVLGGSRVALVIATMTAIAAVLLGGAGLALFLLVRLLVLPLDGFNQPVVVAPPQKQVRHAGLLDQVAARLPVQFDRFAPLPKFADLAAAEQPLPLTTSAGREAVWAQRENDEPIGIQDEAPQGAWLVGVRAVSGEDWGGVLRGLRPIYQNEKQYQLGQQLGPADGKQQIELLAKPGFAVSGIRFQRGLVVNAVQLVYSRVVDTHFDLADSYNSDWFGFVDAREIHLVSGEGFPIVGLAGHHDGGCFARIALIRSKSSSDILSSSIMDPDWTKVGEFPKLSDPQSALLSFTALSPDVVAGSEDGDTTGLTMLAAPEGAWLIGMRVTTGRDWGGVISAVQPIFQSGCRYEPGERVGASGGERQTEVIAKPGFAIAKIELQRGLVVNSIRITFARVVNTHFDMTDTYTTAWLGLADGRPAELQSSGGRPVCGLAYSFDGQCFSDLRLCTTERIEEASQ